MECLSSQTGHPDIPRFDPWQGKKINFSSEAFESALGPTQPPTQLVPVVKRMGRETDVSPHSSTDIKKKLIRNFIPFCRTLNIYNFCVFIIILLAHRPRQRTPDA